VRISAKGLEHFLNIIKIHKSAIQKTKKQKGTVIDPDKAKKKLKKYKPVVKEDHKSQKLNPSLLTNKLYFNLVMLGLFLAISKIERSKDLLLDEDTKADLKVLKRKVITLLNPVIKERLRSKSVMITVNGFVGFDTEYEEENEKDLKNRLLSVQLASTSGLTVIVPKRELKPLNSYLFKHNSPSG
jgi:hypothetical protein